jgi:hypothetical protein
MGQFGWRTPPKACLLMDTTANLDLPYIMAAQAQKHVTHNEALRALDALVQLAVLDKDLATPPGSPAEGDRYIVAAGATGAWSGQDGKIAAYQDGAWTFYAPNEGWTAWVADEDQLYAWDGSAWDKITSGREVLTAARTYYVRADGSDANTGLANTSGGAFLTIQKAIDTVTGLDLGNYDATIQIASGTWTENLTLKTVTGAGTAILRGDPVTPANVTLSISAGTALITATKIEGLWRLDGLKLTTSGGTRHGLLVTGAKVDFQNIEFAAHTGDHMRVQDSGGLVTATGPYTISGGGVSHQYAAAHGMIRTFGVAVTLTGTPSFSAAYARADSLGLFRSNGMSFSGSASGTRYTVDSNAVIYTAGGGPTYFPGSGAGTTANGGQYV